MQTNAMNPADGQYVVIQNNQRVTGTVPTQEQAQREADQRNRVLESSGQPVKEGQRAAVKQNLFG